jgi:hypothetical protein
MPPQKHPADPEPDLYDTKIVPRKIISPIERYPLNAIQNLPDEDVPPDKSHTKVDLPFESEQVLKI